MNDDINIYDGKQIEVNISISVMIILYPVIIEGSSEAKSRNTWVEMFDMIGMNFFKIMLTLEFSLL